MKKISIILFAFILTLVCNKVLKSQTFEKIVDTTKTWNILQGDIGLQGYVYSTQTIIFKNDSFVNNHTYKKIYLSYDSIAFSYIGLIREDSIGKVYLYDSNNPEKLVYDFTVNIGDTLYLPTAFGNLRETRVDSIDTVFSAGKNRKRIFTSYNFGYKTDYWLEGIGSMMGVLYSGNFSNDYSTNLLCFWENTTSQLNTNYSDQYGCHFTNVGINENTIENKIKVYPNISSQNITIEHQQNDFISINIYNSLGQIVLRNLIEEKSQEINISDFINGIYFYQISDLKGTTLLQGKLVKIK